MPQSGPLGEPRRQEVFRFLVSAQEMDRTVAESHEYIREHFGLAAAEVRRIEDEGVKSDWRPL